jgi:predicted aldo/keto reductase-like oxidoreductase
MADKCPTRRFGRTGIDIPVLTCGGMRLQQSWSAPDGFSMADVDDECQQGVEDIIAKSFSVGINHFETARGYGSSELQYGVALKKHMDAGLFKREDFILQTKVSPSETAEAFKKNMEKSWATLDLDGNGLGYVDLFAFHGINSARKLDWVLKEGGCLEVIRQYQKEGKIRWIGFSTHGMEPLITKACATGEFDYINLHHQFIGSFTASGSGATGGTRPSVEAARAQDMGVFIISPTDKGGMLFKPPVKFAAACEPLSPIEFNNLWLLSLKNTETGDDLVHTLVVGAARPTDFDEHMKSVAGYEAAMLDGSQITAIETKLRGMFLDAVGEKWANNWWKGLPDPFGNIDGEGELVNVPQNPHAVNYGVMCWLWGICEAWDLHEFARQRFGMLVNNGKSYQAKLADGKTNVEYVTTLMGDFGPGTDCMDLDAEALAAPVAGAACKEGVLAALVFCQTKLHPDVCKGFGAPQPNLSLHTSAHSSAQMI